MKRLFPDRDVLELVVVGLMLMFGSAYCLAVPLIMNEIGPSGPPAAGLSLLIGAMFGGAPALWAACLTIAALADRWAVVRVPAGMSIALAGYIAFTGGLSTGRGPAMESQLFMANTMLLPLFFLASLAPCCAFRFWAGWRLGWGGDGQAASPSQNRIVDLMIATAVVAAAFGLAKLRESTNFDPWMRIEWGGIAIFGGVLMLYCAVWIPATVWLVLRWRQWPVAFLITPAVGAASALVLLAALDFAAEGPGPPPSAYGMLIAMHVAAAILLNGFLLLLRLMGYRLRTAGDEQQANRESEPTITPAHTPSADAPRDVKINSAEEPQA